MSQRRPDAAQRARSVAGLALLALAALAFCLRPVVGQHDRAWSADARPASSYELVAGRLYHLSSVEGPTGAAQAPLSCTWRPMGGAQTAGAAAPLATTPGSVERVTHVIASFVAPATGQVQVACAGLGAVFIDDVQGLGRDRSSLLLLIGTALGVAGLCLAASGVRSPRAQPRPGSGPATGPVPGSTVQGITVVPASGT